MLDHIDPLSLGLACIALYLALIWISHRVVRAQLKADASEERREQIQRINTAAALRKAYSLERSKHPDSPLRYPSEPPRGPLSIRPPYRAYPDSPQSPAPSASTPSWVVPPMWLHEPDSTAPGIGDIDSNTKTGDENA